VAECVAVHQRVVVVAQFRHRVAIHQQPGRGGAVEAAEEPGHRAAHGERGGPPDVQLVDFADGRGGHADREGVLPDQVRQRVAPGLREGLAVTDAGHRLRALGKDDGRGHHWTSQGAAACFVHADQEPPVRPAPRLVGERGAEGRHRG